MKRLCPIIWLIFLASISAAAQLQDTQESKVFAPQWEEFSVLESVAFSSHKYEDGSGFYYDDKSQALASSRRYSDKISGTYYFIFSDPSKSPFQKDKVFEFIKYSGADSHNARIGKLQGERYKFTDADGFYHTVLWFRTRDRSYVFQTISENENDSPAEHFLASIKFHAAKIPSIIRRPSLFGSGGGTGSGNGTSDCRQGYRPLQILSQPEPDYNDFARIYGIFGTIDLQIKFQANGELGEILPLSKLPFGLTKNTIEAARRIKFSPPAMNDVPYTETRVVKYYLKYW